MKNLNFNLQGATFLFHLGVGSQATHEDLFTVHRMIPIQYILRSGQEGSFPCVPFFGAPNISLTEEKVSTFIKELIDASVLSTLNHNPETQNICCHD